MAGLTLYNHGMWSTRVDAFYCFGLFMGAFCVGLCFGNPIASACFGAVFATLCFLTMFAIAKLTRRGK